MIHELHPHNPNLIPAAKFNPSPELAERLLSEMNDTEISFASIARAADTSIESLCLWLTRPEIAERLDAVESVFARRTRLQVANHSGAIVNACATVVEVYGDAQSRLLFRENDLRGHAILARQASNALLASRILLHLSRHFSNPPTPRPTRPQPTAPIAPNAPEPESPAPAPDSNTPTTHHSRFTLLPPLTPLTIHLNQLTPSTPDTLTPAPPNPTRNNAHPTPAQFALLNSHDSIDSPESPAPSTLKSETAAFSLPVLQSPNAQHQNGHSNNGRYKNGKHSRRPP